MNAATSTVPAPARAEAIPGIVTMPSRRPGSVSGPKEKKKRKKKARKKFSGELSTYARHQMRQAMSALIATHGYKFREVMEIACCYAVDTALLLEKECQVKAAKRLDISREYVARYKKRGARLVGREQ